MFSEFSFSAFPNIPRGIWLKVPQRLDSCLPCPFYSIFPIMESTASSVGWWAASRGRPSWPLSPVESCYEVSSELVSPEWLMLSPLSAKSLKSSPQGLLLVHIFLNLYLSLSNPRNSWYALGFSLEFGTELSLSQSKKLWPQEGGGAELEIPPPFGPIWRCHRYLQITPFQLHLGILHLIIRHFWRKNL